jgi:tetratricopeptide (TPR) repeat protein
VAYHNAESDLALEWLSLARQADDTLPQVQYTEALIARQTGDYGRALEIFTQLETLESWEYSSEFLDQRFEHFLPLDIARTHMQQGNYETAIEGYTGIIETTGGWPRIYIERAEAYLALDDTEAARADFIAARELADDPDLKDTIMERILELGEAAPEDDNQ